MVSNIDVYNTRKIVPVGKCAEFDKEIAMQTEKVMLSLLLLLLLLLLF